MTDITRIKVKNVCKERKMVIYTMLYIHGISLYFQTWAFITASF